jgi:ABC-type multidrug transport system fused ATPase/permease subunit
MKLLASARVLIGLMPATTRRSVRFAIICGFLLAAVEFVAIFLLYPVFGFLSQGDTTTLAVPLIGVSVSRAGARSLAILALGLLIARSLLTLGYRVWWLRTTAKAELQLSDRLLRTYAYAPYSFHLGTLSTDLMARAVANVSLACQSGLVGLVGMVSSTLLAVGLAAALVAASPLAGIGVTAYVGVLAGAYVVASRRHTRRLTDRLENQIRSVYGRVSTLLRGIREITVFGQREHYLSQISSTRTEMVSTNAKVMLLQDIPRTILESALYSTILVALAVLLSIDDPDRALPLVALYVVAGLRIMPSLTQVLGYLASARAGTRIAESLAEEINSIEAVSSSPTALRSVHATCATLSLNKISYRYSDDSPDVLADVSLNLPFGTHLGIIGPSGAGKTTLTSVVLGLLPATNGQMVYGGQPVASNDSLWFAKVAVVPQDVFLTDDSLLANILAGAPYERDRLDMALQGAGLDDLVYALPEGVDTLMLEGGARLSAGQRQRVGLARALYRRPEILVLDEPTSALDAETEAHIMSTVDRLHGQITILTVAHRTHTLEHTDLVLRLEDGHIVALGSPDAVL